MKKHSTNHDSSNSSKHWEEITKAPQQFIEGILTRYIFRVSNSQVKQKSTKRSLILKAHTNQALVIFNQSSKNEDTIILSFFLNDSGNSSSVLLHDATALASKKWPGHTVYTIIDGQDENSPNVMSFFKTLGWSQINLDSELIKFELKLNQDR